MKWELKTKEIKYCEVSNKEFEERLAEVIQILLRKRSQLEKVSSLSTDDKPYCPFTSYDRAS